MNVAILSDTIKPCPTWNNITLSCALVFMKIKMTNWLEANIIVASMSSRSLALWVWLAAGFWSRLDVWMQQTARAELCHEQRAKDTGVLQEMELPKRPLKPQAGWSWPHWQQQPVTCCLKIRRFRHCSLMLISQSWAYGVTLKFRSPRIVCCLRYVCKVHIPPTTCHFAKGKEVAFQGWSQCTVWNV